MTNKYTLRQQVRIKVGPYKGWTGTVHSSYTIEGQVRYMVIPFGTTIPQGYTQTELEPLDDRD